MIDQATRTTAEDAIDIAQAALVRRVLSRMPGLLDEDEARQEVALYVLERLDKWDPERGALSTFVQVLFDQWWRDNIADRRSRAASEVTFDPTELWNQEAADLLGSDDLAFGTGETQHDTSPLVQELLDMVSPEYREAIESHVCYGTTRVAAAELAGVSDTRLRNHLRTAIKRWRKHYGVEEAVDGPPEGHVDVDGAVALTGLSVAYLAQLRKEGVLGPNWHKRGRRVYYDRDGLIAWNEQRLAAKQRGAA